MGNTSEFVFDPIPSNAWATYRDTDPIWIPESDLFVCLLICCHCAPSNDPAFSWTKQLPLPCHPVVYVIVLRVLWNKGSALVLFLCLVNMVWKLHFSNKIQIVRLQSIFNSTQFFLEKMTEKLYCHIYNGWMIWEKNHINYINDIFHKMYISIWLAIFLFNVLFRMYFSPMNLCYDKRYEPHWTL